MIPEEEAVLLMLSVGGYSDRMTSSCCSGSTHKQEHQNRQQTFLLFFTLFSMPSPYHSPRTHAHKRMQPMHTRMHAGMCHAHIDVLLERNTNALLHMKAAFKRIAFTKLSWKWFVNAFLEIYFYCQDSRLTGNGERYSKVTRLRNRTDGAARHHCLCDMRLNQ